MTSGEPTCCELKEDIARAHIRMKLVLFLVLNESSNGTYVVSSAFRLQSPTMNNALWTYYVSKGLRRRFTYCQWCLSCREYKVGGRARAAQTPIWRLSVQVSKNPQTKAWCS